MHSENCKLEMIIYEKRKAWKYTELALFTANGDDQSLESRRKTTSTSEHGDASEN